MSDATGMFSAAPSKRSTDIESKPPLNDFQWAYWKPLPSNEVLQALGKAAIRFGQLEHLLKLAYKRTGKDISLADSLELTFSLGALLNGIHGGRPIEFEGLRNLAKSNPQLAQVEDEMRQAADLSPIRKRYLHNGMGRNSKRKFVGLDSGEEFEEVNMLAELNAASNRAESILSEIDRKTRSGK